MLPDLKEAFIADLIDFGAVYHNRRKLTKDSWVTSGDYIRVHASPRRYPEVYSYDWQEALIHVDIEGGFVVVHKPRGVPVAPTIDNAKECVVTQVEEILDVKLLPTHRMDVDTSGLLVLATKRKFVGKFNHELKNGNVQRNYRALVRPQSEKLLLEPSMLTHYIDATNRRTPRIFIGDLPAVEDEDSSELGGDGSGGSGSEGSTVSGSSSGGEESGGKKKKSEEKSRWLKCEMEILSARSCELAWAPWDHQQELLQHVEVHYYYYYYYYYYYMYVA
jgi:hypothetical protein